MHCCGSVIDGVERTTTTKIYTHEVCLPVLAAHPNPTSDPPALTFSLCSVTSPISQRVAPK